MTGFASRRQSALGPCARFRHVLEENARARLPGHAEREIAAVVARTVPAPPGRRAANPRRAGRPAPRRSRRAARRPESRRPARRSPAPPAAPGRRCRCGSGTRTRRRRRRFPPAPRRRGCRETPRRDTALASCARAGPSPTTSLVPGRSSLRKASRFFSTATRPTVRKIGRGRSSARVLARGRNSVGIDAARPQLHVLEAARR